MKRIKLTVAYDGTAYSGWQIQKNSNTIEGELAKCLKDLLEEDVRIIGASRTDAGVHALCNIAVFDTLSRMPGDKFAYAMNQKLPEDIKVRKSEEVPVDFHPRQCLSLKTYEYRIVNAAIANPTRRLYTYFTYANLDITKMREGAAYLVGEHDFRSFCTVGAQVETTIRDIHSVSIDREGEEISIKVTGKGFLYNMVRIIAGTLMEIGKGNWEPLYIKDILRSGDRQKAGPTAPASGLTLIDYKFF